MKRSNNTVNLVKSFCFCFQKLTILYYGLLYNCMISISDEFPTTGLLEFLHASLWSSLSLLISRHSLASDIPLLNTERWEYSHFPFRQMKQTHSTLSMIMHVFITSNPQREYKLHPKRTSRILMKSIIVNTFKEIHKATSNYFYIQCFQHNTLYMHTGEYYRV